MGLDKVYRISVFDFCRTGTYRLIAVIWLFCRIVSALFDVRSGFTDVQMRSHDGLRPGQKHTKQQGESYFRLSLQIFTDYLSSPVHM